MKTLLFFIFIISTDQVMANSFSLSEVIKIALERNTDIQIKKNEVNAKEKMAEAAGVWSNPEISIERENLKDSASNETTSTKIGLSQTFSPSGKLSSQKEAAQLENELEKINLSELELKIKIIVTQLAFEYAADTEKARHTEERLRRFQSIYSYLKTRSFASPQKQTEALIVSSKMLILKRELLKSNSKVNLTWNKLNYYLGLNEKADLKLSWLDKEISLKESSILEKSAKKNPDIRRLKLELDKAQIEKDIASKNIWPDVTVFGSTSSGSGFAPEKGYALGLSVPLPIFSKNNSLKEAQSLKVDSDKLRLTNSQAYLPTLVNSLYVKFNTSQSAALAMPTSSIQKIEDDLAKTDLGFKKGLVDLVSYIEADSQHFETIEAIYGAQQELIEALGEITLLTGEFLIPLEK